MPLAFAPKNQMFSIKKIAGNTDTKRFLESLGFVPGEKIQIVSEVAGNFILNVKNSRIAIDKEMATKIFV